MRYFVKLQHMIDHKHIHLFEYYFCVGSSYINVYLHIALFLIWPPHQVTTSSNLYIFVYLVWTLLMGLGFMFLYIDLSISIYVKQILVPHSRYPPTAHFNSIYHKNCSYMYYYISQLVLSITYNIYICICINTSN